MPGFEEERRGQERRGEERLGASSELAYSCYTCSRESLKKCFIKKRQLTCETIYNNVT